MITRVAALRLRIGFRLALEIGSVLSICRLPARNSTRPRTSGSTCVKAISQIGYSVTTTTSSKPPAQPGTSSSPSTAALVKGNSYQWKVNPYNIFKVCADDLYEVLLGRVRRVKSATQLGSDQEYWMGCEKVVMSAKDDLE
jgi:hypothetical protein